MSIIHRSHGGANERNPRDHAGPAPADHALDGFEERLLAELKVVVAQQAFTATHPQARRRARRPRPARPLLLTGAAPAASAAGPAGRRRRAGLLAGGLALTAAGMAAVIVVASAGPAVPGGPGGPRGGHHAVALRLPARQILLTAATAAAAGTARTGSYWYVRMTTVNVFGKDTQQTWTRPDGKTWVRGVGSGDWLIDGRGKGRRQFSLAGYDWMFTQNPHVIAGHLPAWMRRKVRDPGWTIMGVLGNGRWFALGPWQQAALRHGAGHVSFGHLQRLPASPAGLQAWLRAFERKFTQRTGVPTPEPGALIQSLTELVAGLPAPPQVRAAAFRVLATLPNVTSLGPVHGGQALRISLGGNTHATLMVDPSTSQAREILTVSYGPGPHMSNSVAVSARWVNWRP